MESKLKPAIHSSLGRHSFHTLQAAHKAGIEIDLKPAKPIIEQEQADIT